MRNKGFTIIEIIVVVAIVGILASFILPVIVGKNSENYATENMQKFIDANHIEVRRKSCAADRDYDGYGSCTVVTTDGEKIFLQCPSNTLSISGANNCKEISGNIKVDRSW